MTPLAQLIARKALRDARAAAEPRYLPYLSAVREASSLINRGTYRGHFFLGQHVGQQEEDDALEFLAELRS